MPYLKYVAAIPCEITQKFKLAANMQEYANKMQ